MNESYHPASVDTCNDWSVPVVGLQVQAFTRIFDKKIVEWSQGRLVPKDVKMTAEILCELSRKLINLAFGRTTISEWSTIADMFAEAADQIDHWSLSISDSSEQSHIKAFTMQIRMRTGLLKITGKTE